MLPEPNRSLRQRALTWLVPQSLRQADDDALRRAELIPAFALLGSAAAVVMGAVTVVLGHVVEGTIFFAGAFVALFIPWVLRATESLALAGHFDTFVWWGTLAAIGFVDDPKSPAVMASATAALVATFLVGGRAGWIWAGISTLHLSAMVAQRLHAHGDLPLRYAVDVFCAWLFMLVALGVALAWEAQKQGALAALRRQATDFRALIEGSSEAIVVHRAGTILYANAACARVLGRDVDELVGSSWYDLLDDRDAHSSLPSAEPIMVECCTRPNGDTVHLETAEVEVHFDGAPATVVVARDVSERHRLQTRIAMSDRMASVGTLAAGVAHEINNPLTYVLTNLDLAMQDLKTRGEPVIVERLSPLLADASEGAQRVKHIVGDLQGMARGTQGSRSVVQLQRVLDNAIAMTHHEIRHRAQLNRHFAPAPPVWGDETKLTQVFVNLLINAAQALPDGHADEHEVSVSLRTDDDGRPVIEIRDTGAGISANDMRRIFDPFFTTKPVGMGVGLGLAICHQIVEDSAGEISVDSELGTGTVFTVAFPPHAAAELETTPPVLPPAPAPRSRRLLVIDDDARVAEALRRALRTDFDVVILTSARDALSLHATGEHFDVILCDLMMPNMSGIEYYAALEDSDPELACRVLFCTGGAFSAESRPFLEQQQTRTVRKPFHIDTLRSRLLTVAGEEKDPTEGEHIEPQTCG